MAVANSFLRSLAIGTLGVGVAVFAVRSLAPSLPAPDDPRFRPAQQSTAILLAPDKDGRRPNLTTLTREEAGELAIQEWVRARLATPVSPGEVFSRLGERLTTLLPFVSGILNAVEMLDLRDAVKAIETGIATEEQRDSLLTASMEQARLKTWRAHLAYLATRLPARAGEVAVIAFLAHWFARRRKSAAAP